MGETNFTASLSQSQGREGWCILFRHPARNKKDGRPGYRVRRGLGTADREEAQKLVDEMNEILRTPALWNAAARETAARRFKARVVSAFYDPLLPDQRDPWGLRESVVPLPTKNEGYAHILFLGTTGAGKTTIVRQLLGTDPKLERFPSVSPAKTTVNDWEIVLPGLDETFNAVVTFHPKDKIRQLIEDCITQAAQAYLKGSDATEVERKFLVHEEMRFRLSYLLGTSGVNHGQVNADDLEDDTEVQDEDEADAEISEEERNHLRAKLLEYLERIGTLASQSLSEVREQIDIDPRNVSGEDAAIVEGWIEEALHEKEDYQSLVDDVLDDIEQRFELLDTGTLEYDRSHWPLFWRYQSIDRHDFIRSVNRFSSNYAPNFGHLLAPVVQGVRVAGPFKPEWLEGDEVRLVLMDGEGLGHTPESTSSISTSITSRFSKVDGILLVDNAAQPMQAAPSAALRSIATTGHQSKLAIALTHFDQVHGDNIRGNDLRKAHVINSFDSTVAAIGRELGSRRIENALSACKSRIFFLSNIQEPLTEGARFTRNQMRALTQALQATIQLPPVERVTLVYSTPNLAIALESAMRAFHERWEALLGLEYHPTISREHWARIKALSRRLAEMTANEYSDLRPVADMIKFINVSMVEYIEKPKSWEPRYASVDLRDATISLLAQRITDRLHEFAARQLWTTKTAEWMIAYQRRYAGSTRVRAQDIKGIYDVGAPIPTEVAPIEREKFLGEVQQLFRDALQDMEGRLEE